MPLALDNIKCVDTNVNYDYPHWMRSYEQFCAIAKALDVVGDRWTLLIVRELLLRGACRYTDLRQGLPGIATNLLADRLRDLAQADIVRREAARPPVATDLFALTERGVALAPVLEALGRWGGPLMTTQGANDDFRSHCLPESVHTSFISRSACIADALPVVGFVYATLTLIG